MKFSVLQDNLVGALGKVVRSAATRTTLPITQNVLIETDNGRLKLTATNLEQAMSVWIGAQIDEEGAITVPARTLVDYIRTLPAERIDVSVEGEDAVKIKCAKSRTSMKGWTAEDFPPTPTVTEGQTISIGPETLKQAIDMVAPFAAKEDSRPILTAVRTEIEGETLTMAFADGFRMGVYKTTITDAAEEPIKVNIPATALIEVGRYLNREADDIQIGLSSSKSHIVFRLTDMEITTAIVSGMFPNYAQLIPAESSTTAIVDAEALLRALRSAMVFSIDGSGIVRFQFEGEGESDPIVRVSGKSDINDTESEVELVKLEGDDNRIALNGKYAIEMLGTLGGEIKLGITAPSSAMLIEPTNGLNYQHVIMPMSVQW